MLEMIVRTVDHDPKFGSPVAMLLPRDLTACAPLALPIDASEACSLTHELERQITPRAQAFALLAQAVAAINGYISAIVLEPDHDGDPAARVHVRLPQGTTEHPTDIASALGLAVFTTLPVLVSERLTQSTTGARPTTADESVAPERQQPPAPIPAPFRRALDE